MSRHYELIVCTTNTTRKQLKGVLIEQFDWNVEQLDEDMFVGRGSISGDEEDRHNEIASAIKKLSPNAKVRTYWTPLDNLPFEEYGDELESVA